MEQFLAYVLVHGDLQNARAEADKLMSPYDKALQVAEHNGQCPCVAAQVEAKAREIADDLAQKACQQRESSGAESERTAFERVTKSAFDHQEAQRAAVQELLDKAAPDPNCQACGGSGTTKTTRNPNGKWSRWQIGSTKSGFELEGCLDDVPDDFNIVPVKLINLEAAPMPVAIVTPDGQWHAAGELDWFGTYRIDDPDWYDHTARNIMEQYPDATLVVVECHS